MLTGSMIEQSARLARKRARFLDQLIVAPSIQLYERWYAREDPIAVGFYTLVGINHDLRKVVPFPVLVEILGVSEQEVLDFLRTKPIYIGNRDRRSCAVGQHKHEWEEFVVHGTRCTQGAHEAWKPNDRSSDEEDCVRMTRCVHCKAEWEKQSSPPKRGNDFAPLTVFEGGILIGKP